MSGIKRTPEIKTKYIRRTINKGLLSNDAMKAQESAIYSASYSSTSVMLEAACENRNPIVAKFIRFAYKYRTVLTRIPLLSSFALKVRGRIITDALQNKIDVQDILPLQGNEFVKAAYIRLLGREPSWEEYYPYSELFYQGISTTAIVYLIISSHEFGNRAKVSPRRKIDRAYSVFKLKKAVKRIPLVGRLIMLLTLPYKLEMIDRKLSDYEIKEILRNIALREKMDAETSVLAKRIDIIAELAQYNADIAKASWESLAVLPKVAELAQYNADVAKASSDSLAVLPRIAELAQYNADVAKASSDSLAVLPRIAELAQYNSDVAKASYDSLTILPRIAELAQYNSDVAKSASDSLTTLPRIAELAQNSFEISTACSVKLDLIPAELEWSRTVLTNLSEKTDNLTLLATQKTPPLLPEYTIVNGSIDVDSYLDYAKVILDETGINNGNYYQLFEAVFRGSEEIIKKHQRYYIDYMLENTSLNESKGMYFLDAGCGRGEFLSLLKEHKINAKGVDIDKQSIAHLMKKDFDVSESDMLIYLESIKDSELMGLSSFQVIEHLSRNYITDLIEIAFKKISKHGVIILETINPHCFTNHGSFFIDPTHVSWVSPDDLKFNLEYVGFENVKVIFYAPVHPDHASTYDMRCNYIGYAVIASKN